MRKMLPVLLGCVLTAVSAAAHADGMQSSIQDMFSNLGTMSNFTSPGHMSGPNGGVITGGSLQVRNHIMQPSLFSFTAPHISGGCGGLDMFGGSFSYINKQELEQYLKQIASNARTYAFTMGLKLLCPACLDEMEKLQTWTQKMNGELMSSCQVAQKLVNIGDDAIRGTAAYQEYLAATGQAKYGITTDQLAGKNQGPGQSSASSTLAAANQAAAKDIFQGNVIWRALNDGNVSSQFTYGDNSFLMDIMSLTGTVITCIPAQGNTPQQCPAHTGQGADDRPGEPVSILHEHSMSLRDLVYGSKDSGSIEVLTCSDTSQCLDVTSQKDDSFKALAEMLREEFLGTNYSTTACDMGNGIIGKYTLGSNGPGPSSKDWAYINNTAYYGGAVLSLAKLSPLAACTFAYDWADVAATQLAFTLANDSLNAVARAVATSGKDYGGHAAALIADARKRLFDDHAKILREHQVTGGSMVQEYLAIMKTYGRPQMGDMAPAATPNE